MAGNGGRWGSPRAALVLGAAGLTLGAVRAQQVAPDVRLTVPDIPAFTRALGQAAPVRAARATSVVRSLDALLMAGVDFFLTYTCDVPRAAVAKAMPQRATFEVLPPAEPDDLTASPRWYVILDFAESAHADMWRDRVLPGMVQRFADKGMARTERDGIPVFIFRTKNGAMIRCLFSGASAVLGTGSVEDLSGALAAHRAGKGRDVPGSRSDVPASFRIEAGRAVRETIELLGGEAEPVRNLRILGTDALDRVEGEMRQVEQDRFLERLALIARGDDHGRRRFGGVLGVLQSAKPAPFRSLQVAPPETVALLSVMTGGGESLLTVVEDELRKRGADDAVQRIDAGLAMFGAQFGLDMRKDVLAHLRSECFVAVVPAGGRFDLGGAEQPLRRMLRKQAALLVGLQIDDPRAVQNAIRRMLSAPLLLALSPVSDSTRVGEVEITTVHFRRPGRGPLDVSYMFRDGFLLISSPETAQRYARSGGAAHRPELPPGLPGEGTLLVWADTRPVLGVNADVLARLATARWGNRGVPLQRPLAAALKTIGTVSVAAGPSPDGIVVQTGAAVPVVTPLVLAAAVERFGRPRAEFLADAAREQMKEIGKKLRRYYREHNGTPPATLAELVPRYLQDVPADPFAPGRELRYGVAVGGAAWVLASVGPDGTEDVDVEDFSAARWKRLKHPDSPEALQEACRRIYRFRPDKYPEEAAPDDEGDIVVIGQWD